MKLLSILTVAAAVALPCAVANAQATEGVYAGLHYLNLPSQKGYSDESFIGWAIGYQINPYLGVEAFYNYLINNDSYSYYDRTYDVYARTDVDEMLYGADVTFQYPIYNALYVKASAGAFGATTKASTTYSGQYIPNSYSGRYVYEENYNSDVMFHGSAGIGYEFIPLAFAELTYQRFDEYNGVQFQVKYLF